jgi:hypothetical protein
MSRWHKDECGCICGLVSDYSGGDFNGPTECRSCGGQGSFYVSENDRVAMWPGGPFLGMEPGRFARLDAKVVA